MAVDFITYQKKKLPIKIGYFALKMMQKHHGVDMATTTTDLEAYEPLLYYALMQGHKLMKKDFTYELTDMKEILDECFFDFTEKVTSFFPTDLVEKLMAGEGMTKKQR